jgi:hypothetical protein
VRSKIVYCEERKGFAKRKKRRERERERDVRFRKGEEERFVGLSVQQRRGACMAPLSL